MLLGLLLLLIVVAGTGGLLSSGSAAGQGSFGASTPPSGPPPPPLIAPSPSGTPTSSTSISLALSDSRSGASFQCSLGGTSFSPCSSPVGYHSLSDGSHVFRAEAIAGSKTSGVSSYTWVIDTVAPPAPKLLLAPIPASPGAVASTTAYFVACDDADNDGDTGCDQDDRGAATLYCSLDTAAFARCASPLRYYNLAEGPHTFRVYAVDLAGNKGRMTAWLWTVDTVSPATPAFTQTPGSPSSGPAAMFAWTDSSTDVAAYLCSIDDGPFGHCSSPHSFTIGRHGNREHVFGVIAIDDAGNHSGRATYSWKLGSSTGQNFAIAGNATSVLWPGNPAAVLDLTFANPNGANLSLTALTVSIKSVEAPNSTSQLPCHSGDFEVGQYTGTYPLTLPAGSSTLQSDGIAQSKWPTVRMVENHADQNGCVGATVTLTYTGSAR